MESSKIRSFRRSLRKFERILEITNTNCCCEITPAQCHVLMEIEFAGEATTQQLVKSLRLDKSTLSRTIDTLVKNGHLQRTEHPKDRRYTILRLSQKGKKKCNEINNANDEFYQKVMDNIPQSMRNGINSYFESLFNAMVLSHDGKCGCNCK